MYRMMQFGKRIIGIDTPAGFTMVEMVIVVGIIILIASIVLVSFPNFSQGIHLQNSVQRLSLSFRQAQDMSFASRLVSDTCPVIPVGYGLYFNRATPNSYILFADLRASGCSLPASGSGNGQYDAGDIVISTVALDPGISFGDFVTDVGGTNQHQDVLSIIFSVPDANISIKNGAGLVFGTSAQIFLIGTTNLQKSVMIRTTGQVYVK